MGYLGKPEGVHDFGNGLKLRVGKKKSVWYLRLKVNGKYTGRRLGDASAMFNAQHARDAAAELREQNKAGELHRRDEIVGGVHRTELGGALTTFANNMLAMGEWTEAHHTKALSRMKSHLKGLWARPIDKLKRQEIVQYLERLDSRHTASKLYSWIKECLESEADRGALDFCCLGRKPKTLTVPKKMTNTRPSYGADLPKLRALYAAIRDGESGRSVKLAGRLSMCTGLRLGEVLVLRAEYYDAATAELVVPREVMKVKDHWRGDFRVPLSPEAVAIVEEAVEHAHDGFLFTGPWSGKPLTHEAVEKVFRKLTDRQHVPHGTRTSLRTWALEQDHPPMVCAALLDHATSTGSDAHYDKTQFVEQRRGILNAWAEELLKNE